MADESVILGDVWLHLQKHDELLIVIACYQHVITDRATRSAQWRSTGEHLFGATVDVLDVATWLELSAGLVRTLMPRALLD